MTNLNSDHDREAGLPLELKSLQDSRKEEILKERYDRDITFDETLNQELNDAFEEAGEDLEHRPELKETLEEREKIKDEIEDKLIKLDMLSIQVEEFEKVTEMLNDKKESVAEEKKEAEKRLEDLKKELSAKEEIF